MAVDLMIDFTNAGDLVVTPGNDVALVSGQAEVEQRMKVRIKVQFGTFMLDPTLGSTVLGLLRSPTEMVLTQLPLVVKEALATMDDVQVIDVPTALDPVDVRKVHYSVVYALTDGETLGDQLVLNDSLVVS